MAVYLYARVSTDEQTVENQKLLARSAGYTVDYFFSDEGVSGSTDADDREQYSAMMENISKGDVLLVSEISRIGRKTKDVLNSIDKFEKMGVKVCVLNYGNLDLTSPMGRVVITMAAAFSELELSELRRRTKAGMARVKEKGTKLGQPLKIMPEVFESVLKDRAEGLTLEKLSAKHNIPRNTLHANITKWGWNVQGYKEEYAARQKQYAMRSL